MELNKNKFYQAAKWYLKKGFSVIPCKPKTKIALIAWEKYQKQLPTLEEILEWWTLSPDANVAIVLGGVSGIITLEVDDKTVLNGRPIPITPQAISGGKKLPHIYFRYVESMRNYKASDNRKELFSIRGNGQYVLAPPSIHPSGNPYTWVPELGIHQVDLADVPDWITELIVDIPAKEEAERYYKQRDNKFEDNLRKYIETLKGRIRLSDLLIHLGVEKTEEHSRYVQFNCPFHESEGKKSFTVWDDIGVGRDWHDDKNYDAIEFVRAYRNLDFKDALNYLADFAKVDPYNFDLLKSEDNEIQRQSQADKLVALIEKLPVTLFHEEYDEPYARIKVGDHFEIWKVRSRQFKRWLSRQFWQVQRKVPNSDSLNSALNVIEAKACFEGNKYKLHNRVAWYDNAIWYDLGNWKAVKITENGWEIVEQPPILFRRYPHQKTQVTPEACCELGAFELFRFVNVSDEGGELLFLINLVCGFIPDIPHPIDVLHGDQGAAKTTTSRIKKELLDPSELKTLTYPNTKVEFVQMASHHWFFFLDNITGLPEWLSDALCRVCTGEGFSKRELYTDDEDIIYNFMRCACLNGINLIPTKPDLLDRSLIFELDQIPQEERKEEKVFWEDFYKARPNILGSLFQLLSKAMRGYSSVKLKEKPRMADFAHWGCAVARALGKSERDFMKAYLKNIKAQNEEAIEASPVARSVMAFMNDKDYWEGSPNELLEELNKVAEQLKLNVKDRRYPKDSRWLWRRIKEVRPNLQAVGIKASKDDSDHGKGRKITLEKISQPTTPEEDISQQVRKNDVRDEMMSESQLFQGVRTDDTKK